MDELKLVMIAEVDSEFEAKYLQNVLADAGIRAMITGLDVSALGEALEGSNPIEVLVPEADLEQAEALLDEIEEAEAEPVPAWVCACGAEVDAGFEICWSCQAEYAGPATDES